MTRSSIGKARSPRITIFSTRATRMNSPTAARHARAISRSPGCAALSANCRKNARPLSIAPSVARVHNAVRLLHQHGFNAVNPSGGHTTFHHHPAAAQK
ncbi:MAG: hypothetical protein JWM59_4 [Verrucomicrobiales bacterium]|nr:hypothetical protein [Verrucomicrobiales bacterium]